MPVLCSSIWCCCVILAACTVDAAHSMWSSAWYTGLGGRYMFPSVECSELDGNYASSGIRYMGNARDSSTWWYLSVSK